MDIKVELENQIKQKLEAIKLMNLKKSSISKMERLNSYLDKYSIENNKRKENK